MEYWVLTFSVILSSKAQSTTTLALKGSFFPLAFLFTGFSSTPSSINLRFSAAFSFFIARSLALRAGLAASKAACLSQRFWAFLERPAGMSARKGLGVVLCNGADEVEATGAGSVSVRPVGAASAGGA